MKRMILIVSATLVLILAISTIGKISNKEFNKKSPNLKLPEVNEVGIDVFKALEIRATSRNFTSKEVPLEIISSILWAGNGVILEDGDKTIHGYDTISGATSTNRSTIPWVWESHYINTYLLLDDGSYKYIPEEHSLEHINSKNFIKESGLNTDGAHGVIVVAVDNNILKDKNSEISKNISYVAAGSVIQNMNVAGAAHNVQMLPQIGFNENIGSELGLSENIKVLLILPFGYA